MATDHPQPVPGGVGLPPTLIYGAGAVGTWLAGLLAWAGVPVTLLGRPAPAETLRRDGVRIAHGSDVVSARPPVISSIDGLDHPPDLVLIAVKAYAIAAALPDLEQMASAGAALVSLQNGVGTEETLLATGRVGRLAAGALTVSLGLDQPGRVRQETASGGIALAPVVGEVPLAAIATALQAAGVPAGVVAGYQSLKWSKLLLNILANASSAILALSPETIYRDAELFRIERAAFIEALAVMLADGVVPIGLPGFNVPLLTQVMRLPAPLARRLLARRAGRGRGAKRPSLWLDVEQGRDVTEVGWLNGAVAQRGRALGIPTPVNAALAELVDTISRDPAQRDRYAGQPAALIAWLRERSA